MKLLFFCLLLPLITANQCHESMNMTLNFTANPGEIVGQNLNVTSLNTCSEKDAIIHYQFQLNVLPPDTKLLFGSFDYLACHLNIKNKILPQLLKWDVTQRTYTIECEHMSRLFSYYMIFSFFCPVILIIMFMDKYCTPKRKSS